MLRHDVFTLKTTQGYALCDAWSNVLVIFRLCTVPPRNERYRDCSALAEASVMRTQGPDLNIASPPLQEAWDGVESKPCVSRASLVHLCGPLYRSEAAADRGLA